jgi:hypothetical protein
VPEGGAGYLELSQIDLKALKDYRVPGGLLIVYN